MEVTATYVQRVQMQSDGKVSDDIQVLRGLHQGAPCSMFLFMVLINELLQILQEIYPGLKLVGEVINCAAFADDIAILATCKTDLQMLIDIAYRYSVRWRFAFSPTKCVTLVFGKDRQRDMKLRLGNHTLKEVTGEKHLGSILATTPAVEHEYIKKRIGANHFGHSKNKCLNGMLLVKENSEKCPSLIGVTILCYLPGSDSDSINTSK